MQILNLKNVSKSFGSEDVLCDVSFMADSRDKIGFIGSNGAGKTTLFRLITGELIPDGGEITFYKKLKIGYVAQQTLDTDTDNTLWEELRECFSEITELERKINELTEQMSNAADGHLELAKRHAYLSGEFERLGGFGYESRIRAALLGLGFSDNEFDKPVKVLSGGQKTRVALAKVLLDKNDLLLLDEPTNNLDISSCRWLEEMLKNYEGAAIVISHDRYFLDAVTNLTVALEGGFLKVYKGNYSFYVRQYEADRIFEEKQYEMYRREVDRIEGIIEQQKRFNQAHNYVTIKSKKKQIEHMDAVEKPKAQPRSIHFKFGLRENCGNEVLVSEGLEKSYSGHRLFSNVDLFIKKGERVFLLGDNGIGKSTLFKILMGEESADGGTFRLGTNVHVGYYSQQRSDLDPAKTIFEEIHDGNPMMVQTDIRNALAAFAFTGDDVFKKISDLSGGEAGRVALLKLMLSKANFLLLDEPTNHLDIASKEVLENALADYEGTVFAVSHDRYFINKLATRIYYLDGNRITNYAGDYDYFLRKSEENTSMQNAADRNAAPANDYKKRKAHESEVRKAKGRLSRCEKLIAELEEKVSLVEAELANPETAVDYVRTMELSGELDGLNAQLEAEYESWEQLSSMLEELEGE